MRALSKYSHLFIQQNIDISHHSIMIIFNIETSTDACSAAITENGQVMVVNGQKLSRLQSEKSEHAKQLAVYIDELLNELKISGKQLDAVAVSEGPGSYTGLRIGASLAKGLAYGMNLPLIAVPTLQAMAAQVVAQQVVADDTLLCPMIDARRMEVYNAFYNADLKAESDVIATIVDERSFANELTQHNVLFFGNGSGKCKPVITDKKATFLDGIVPDAAYMGRLAEEAFAQQKFVDIAYWTPFYLKEFEAKKSVVKGLN